EMKTKYPNEDFVLSDVGGSRTELFVEVMCNKTLSDKFNLYIRNAEYDKWEPFRFDLGSFWVKPR
ncbi:MAG TPA: hypothetical protein VNX68_01865, partial [Nitrosopumilaceae archaeon]|nr:hypothetical protein [Nitrosopumilaceae archaeon]